MKSTSRVDLRLKIGNAILYHGKCEEVLPTLKNESVDTIITDPPYLYLKHKLDAPFDEALVFENWWRILNDNKLIVFFGRGDPFFRSRFGTQSVELDVRKIRI